MTEENSSDLERVQKSALKIMLGSKYNGYQQSLAKLGIEKLSERREQLCLNFAKKCLRNQKTAQMFPENLKTHHMKTRIPDRYKVFHAKTERFKNSAIIYMQNLLNQDNIKK